MTGTRWELRETKGAPPSPAFSILGSHDQMKPTDRKANDNRVQIVPCTTELHKWRSKTWIKNKDNLTDFCFTYLNIDVVPCWEWLSTLILQFGPKCQNLVIENYWL